MAYILNSNTISFDDEYTDEFFAQLKEALSFPYENLCIQSKEQIIKDYLFEEQTSKEDFINTLYSHDYDISQYIMLMLSSFLSITDIPEASCGIQSDIYNYGGNQYNGDLFSFVELAYENDWCIISAKPVEVDNVVTKIIKNATELKNIYEISDSKQFYLVKSLDNESFLGSYLSSFDNVYCVQNCLFENWDSINATGKLKILSTYHKEISHVIHNEFDKLGHFPGRNSNRVEKINDNLFEYRLANPNYRIYYTRKEDKLIILLCMLKKRGKISTNTMNNLVRLKNADYKKYV